MQLTAEELHILRTYQRPELIDAAEDYRVAAREMDDRTNDEVEKVWKEEKLDAIERPHKKINLAYTTAHREFGDLEIDDDFLYKIRSRASDENAGDYVLAKIDGLLLSLRKAKGVE